MNEQSAKDTKPKEESIKVDPKTGQEVVHVKLYSPFQTYFNQEAFSVSAINETGPFDILPRHHNFITLLNQGEVVIRAPSGDQKVKISHAVMHVKEDHVTIFLDV